ncbi:MAG TPA: class I SAM-dependent methyltransferase [Candidatus Sulfopaludibacter sp.]|jgi:SAM-dependent methyltransferase|nr:class I SAM-dependent methyltransferase [Candidatus Sulfopaludibacter sp.]
MSACLVCGSEKYALLFRGSDRLYHTTRREFSVVRCEQCGMVRLDPLPTPEELPSYYPENYWFAPDTSTASRMEEAYRRLVLRDHVQFVDRAMRQTRARGPLLDVGCGGGLFLGMMRERGFRVLGLDNSREAAGIAWRRQQVPTVCAMLESAPLPEGSIAGLTMFHVMEHLYDPRAYLAAAHRLLAPDGRLIVQVPNAASWQARLLGSAWNGADVPRHLSDFRASDIASLIESGGFEVVRQKFFSLRDNPAGLASSLAPSLDPMARRVRRIVESDSVRLAKDLIYLALVVGSLPFTALEAAFGAGSTVMIEARRK